MNDDLKLLFTWLCANRLSSQKQNVLLILSKTFSCGVFVDLELKLIDTVNHKILLSKLSHYGICGVANNWFSSYLCERQQQLSH